MIEHLLEARTGITDFCCLLKMITQFQPQAPW